MTYPPQPYAQSAPPAPFGPGAHPVQLDIAYVEKRSRLGFHDFCVGAIRWQTRGTAYVYGLTDTYPPFRLQP